MSPQKEIVSRPSVNKKKIITKRKAKPLTEEKNFSDERLRLEGMVRDGKSNQKLSDEQIHRQTGELKTQSDQLRVGASNQKLSDEQIHRQTEELKTQSDQLKVGKSKQKLSDEQIHRQTGELKTQSDQLKVGASNQRIADKEILRQREELLHVTRVGKLAEFVSSLAHEISQPLTAILAYTQAAERMLKGRDPEVQEILQYISNDSKRAAGVISRLRSLLKRGKSFSTLIDLNVLIEETVLLITTDVTIRNKIIRTKLTKGLPLIYGDRIQLQQVILNLISNSLEAMEGIKDARELLVCSSKKDVYTILVEVKDCGCGIPEQNMNKLFTHFFTTKSYGLGMGLSISRSIIEAHGGRLESKNNPDRGANFYFVLPFKTKVSNE